MATVQRGESEIVGHIQQVTNSLYFYIYVNKWQTKSNPKELVNNFIAF